MLTTPVEINFEIWDAGLYLHLPKFCGAWTGPWATGRPPMLTWEALGTTRNTADVKSALKGACSWEILTSSLHLGVRVCKVNFDEGWRLYVSFSPKTKQERSKKTRRLRHPRRDSQWLVRRSPGRAVRHPCQTREPSYKGLLGKRDNTLWRLQCISSHTRF